MPEVRVQHQVPGGGNQLKVTLEQWWPPLPWKGHYRKPGRWDRKPGSSLVESSLSKPRWVISQPLLRLLHQGRPLPQRGLRRGSSWASNQGPGDRGEKVNLCTVNPLGHGYSQGVSRGQKEVKGEAVTQVSSKRRKGMYRVRVVSPNKFPIGWVCECGWGFGWCLTWNGGMLNYQTSAMVKK